MQEAHGPTTHAAEIRNHWWWRPGWSMGSRFYTWHLTFDRAGEFHELVERYQRALSNDDSLDLVPRRWLHLTVQGLGFVGEVEADDVDRIVAAVRARLGRLPTMPLVFDAPRVRPEAVAFHPRSASGLLHIRTAIRDGIADVWGRGGVPETMDGWQPHVTIAYAAEDGSAAPVVQAIDLVQPGLVEVPITTASLILLNRDSRMYQWETLTTAPLR